MRRYSFIAAAGGHLKRSARRVGLDRITSRALATLWVCHHGCEVPRAREGYHATDAPQEPAYGGGISRRVSYLGTTRQRVLGCKVFSKSRVQFLTTVLHFPNALSPVSWDRVEGRVTPAVLPHHPGMRFRTGRLTSYCE